MPRGHKSKRRHVAKKCAQASADSLVGEDAQVEVPLTAEAAVAAREVEQGAAAATIGEEQEEMKEPSFSKDPPGAAYWSSPLIPATSGLSTEGSVVASNKVSDWEYEENLPEANFGTESVSEVPHCPIQMLEWFILQKFHLKQLITLEDMMNAVHEVHRDAFPEIFKSACDHLEVIFAVEVRELESRCNTYNLISKLSLPNNGRVLPGRGYPKTGILMKILALILIKNHCAAEEDIWKFLKKMQVYPSKVHAIFGHTKRLLTHYFVRLEYLEYRLVPGSVPPCHEFLWGPQAHAETSKEKIMKYLMNMKKISPPDFTYLYEDVLKEKVKDLEAALAACSVSTPNPSEVVKATCTVPPPKPEDA